MTLCDRPGASIALFALCGIVLVGQVNAQSEAPSGQSATAAGSLELPIDIRRQLASLPHGENPAAPLAVLKFDLVTGRSTRSSQSRYERLDSGLLGVSTLLGGKGAILSRVLTLKGMVELASTTESTIEIELSNTVAVGKMFFPYSIHRTLRTSSVRNTTVLSGDLAALIQPQAGTRFSYAHSWENEYSSSAAFSSKKVVTNTFNVTCGVANPADVSTLHQQLRGKYLRVVCEGTNREGETFTNEFAYLLDSQIYLRLAASNKLGQTKYTLTGVEYVR